MNKNEKGFSAVEGLLVVIVIGLVGAVGWFVWGRQKNTPTSQQPTSNTSQATESKSADAGNKSPSSGDVLQDGEIKKITAISLKTASDVDKLPTYTPPSFKSYMQQKMASNDTHGCGNEASVSIISLTVIAGSSESTVYSVPEGICQGDGMGNVWYLDTSGKWNSVNMMDACTRENDGTKISASFMQNAMHDMCSAFTDSKY